jgi:hypothetical protein
MQVRIVRSAQAGCEPDCREWISAQGKIDPGTLRRFKTVLRQMGGRKLPVFIHSGGGSVRESFAIGRLLRAKGLDVVVTHTLFTPCAPADAACRKRESQGIRQGSPQAISGCASACAFILAAGTRRFAPAWRRRWGFRKSGRSPMPRCCAGTG